MQHFILRRGALFYRYTALDEPEGERQCRSLARVAPGRASTARLRLRPL